MTLKIELVYRNNEGVLRVPPSMGIPSPHQLASTPADNLIELAGRICFDERVEVFTKNGWVKIKDLNPSQDVLTFNPESNILEWQTPINKTSRIYSGNMYCVDSNGVKIRTTIDHRWYIREYEESDFRIEPASNLLNKRFAVKKSAILPGNQVTYTLPPYNYTQTISNQFGSYGTSVVKSIPGYVIPTEQMQDFCHLLGWYFSEGYAVKNQKSAPKIVIYQNERYVNNIVETIKNLGYKFGVYKDERNDVYHISVYNSILARYLMQFGKNSYEKSLPKEVFNLAPEYRLAIIESLVLGDGTQLSSGMWNYRTVSKQLADDVQILLTSIGIATSLTSSYDSKQNLLIYNVRMLCKDEQTINLHNITIESVSNESVYCVNVPNTLLLVRSCDQIVIIGNCYDSLGAENSRSSKEYHFHINEVGHGSVQEHMHVPLQINTEYKRAWEILLCLTDRPGIHVTNVEYREGVAISLVANIRSIIEWNKFSHVWRPKDVNEELRNQFSIFAHRLCPLATQNIPFQIPFNTMFCDVVMLHSITPEQTYVSFYLSDISRNLTHELVRHKWCTAISQRSTRYVDECDSPIIHHPMMSLDQSLFQELEIEDHINEGRTIYQKVTDKLQKKMVSMGVDKFTARKQARAAASRYLPHGHFTECIFTASLPQWLEIIRQRASSFADAEIRLLANRVYDILLEHNLIDKLEEKDCPDGFGKQIIVF